MPPSTSTQDAFYKRLLLRVPTEVVEDNLLHLVHENQILRQLASKTSPLTYNDFDAWVVPVRKESSSDESAFFGDRSASSTPSDQSTVSPPPLLTKTFHAPSSSSSSTDAEPVTPTQSTHPPLSDKPKKKKVKIKPTHGFSIKEPPSVVAMPDSLNLTTTDHHLQLTFKPKEDLNKREALPLLKPSKNSRFSPDIRMPTALSETEKKRPVDKKPSIPVIAEENELPNTIWFPLEALQKIGIVFLLVILLYAGIYHSNE